MSDNLERRLASALSDDSITSSMLTSLIGEAGIAIADADVTAEKERTKALDPALSPDLRKARAAMEDATFAANRLRIVCRYPSRPISAVRDLYGTMLNEGAARGILVATSRYGRDAYDFASNKPITLIDGQNLLSLLARHGYQFKIELA